MQELRTLIGKEITLEWRQRYALNGMLLYIVSTVFVCYLSFKLKSNQLTAHYVEHIVLDYYLVYGG